jgi:hypothetical protein
LIRAAKRGSTMAMLKIVVDEMVNGKNLVYLEKKTHWNKNSEAKKFR